MYTVGICRGLQSWECDAVFCGAAALPGTVVCNLTRLIALYSFNRNVTLKMAGLSAETYRWKYPNKNTSFELNEFCWYLIHVAEINARMVERIKIDAYVYNLT